MCFKQKMSNNYDSYNAFIYYLVTDLITIKILVVYTYTKLIINS